MADERRPAALILSDGRLLAVYEKLAAAGDRAARTRAAMLRARLEGPGVAVFPAGVPR
jgi:hypothetical protein